MGHCFPISTCADTYMLRISTTKLVFIYNIVVETQETGRTGKAVQLTIEIQHRGRGGGVGIHYPAANPGSKFGGIRYNFILYLYSQELYLACLVQWYNLL